MSKLKNIKVEEKKGSDLWKVVVILLLLLAAFVVYSIMNPPKQISKRSLTDNDAFKGSDNAKVTIVEFSDFQCPACKLAHPIVKQLIDYYGDKIKFVYRDFPLDVSCNASMSRQLHVYACKASEAAECAKDQGKFWEYHNTLFENQDNLAVDALSKHAQKLGLDIEKFNSCLLSGSKATEVAGDVADGIEAGVNSTPTFFINNVLYNNIGFDGFKQVIDTELAK